MMDLYTMAFYIMAQKHCLVWEPIKMDSSIMVNGIIMQKMAGVSLKINIRDTNMLGNGNKTGKMDLVSRLP